MGSITLKGREIPLYYSTWELKTLQEEIGPMQTAIRLVLGRSAEDEDDTSSFGSAEHLKAAATLIRILGNAGLEEAGEAPDLTEKKILRAMKPAELVGMVSECLDVMNEAMASEIPAKKEEGPVDVTLEEMKKKEQKES